MTRNTQPKHITEGSVLLDLGLPPERAAALQIKADLHRALLRFIRRQKLSRADLARRLGEPAPRISELMRGKIASTSIEKLLGYAAALGLSSRIITRPVKPESPHFAAD